MGFPHTPFLTVTENFPLYRQLHSSPLLYGFARNLQVFPKFYELCEAERKPDLLKKSCRITIQNVDLKVKNTNRIENEGDLAQNQGRGDTGITAPPQQV